MKRSSTGARQAHAETTAAGWPRWNSTVVSLNGQITLGSKIELVSTLVPNRTFRLKVKEFEPNARLTSGDAMSTRTYSLSGDAGGTRVEVVERIGGPFFPFLAPMIPPFDENFEHFTADLKKAAEAAATSGASPKPARRHPGGFNQADRLSFRR